MGDQINNTDLVGSAITGGSSLLGSLVGFLSSRSLARQQNQYNIEQWNRENAYNTPKAQMARFKDAGLNPNLIVGQQNLSAPSPELVAGAPFNPSGFPDAVRQGALLDSQINLNNANAQKALGQDALSGSLINLNNSKEELNKLYGEKVVQEIDNLKSTREQIIAKTNQIVSEQKLTDLKSVEQAVNNVYADEKARSQIALWNAECKKYGADAKEVLTLLMAKLSNINADTLLKGKQASEANNMAAVLYNAYSTGKIDLEFIQQHPELHAFGNGASEVIPAVNSLGQFINNVLPFFSPTHRAVAVAKAVK